MFTEDEFRQHLAAVVRRSATQKQAARKLGISQQYLNDILQSRRAPGKSILAAMGYERVVHYRALEVVYAPHQ